MDSDAGQKQQQTIASTKQNTPAVSNTSVVQNKELILSPPIATITTDNKTKIQKQRPKLDSKIKIPGQEGKEKNNSIDLQSLITNQQQIYFSPAQNKVFTTSVAAAAGGGVNSGQANILNTPKAALSYTPTQFVTLDSVNLQEQGLMTPETQQPSSEAVSSTVSNGQNRIYIQKEQTPTGYLVAAAGGINGVPLRMVQPTMYQPQLVQVQTGPGQQPIYIQQMPQQGIPGGMVLQMPAGGQFPGGQVVVLNTPTSVESGISSGEMLTGDDTKPNLKRKIKEEATTTQLPSLSNGQIKQEKKLHQPSPLEILAMGAEKAAKQDLVSTTQMIAHAPRPSVGRPKGSLNKKPKKMTNQQLLTKTQAPFSLPLPGMPAVDPKQITAPVIQETKPVVAQPPMIDFGPNIKSTVQKNDEKRERNKEAARRCRERKMIKIKELTDENEILMKRLDSAKNCMEKVKEFALKNNNEYFY